jgi:hypothetical protein
MAGQYASQTAVSSDRSRAEIEKTLRRYGATSFAYGWNEHAATIVFEMNDRRVRFALPLPDPKERRFTHTDTGKPRAATVAETAYEQAVRQSWRALNLVIKAKLEAVASNIATVEQEFLAYIVDPATNETVGNIIAPQLEKSYKTLPNGRPPMLSLTDGA